MNQHDDEDAEFTGLELFESPESLDDELRSGRSARGGIGVGRTAQPARARSRILRKSQQQQQQRRRRRPAWVFRPATVTPWSGAPLWLDPPIEQNASEPTRAPESPPVTSFEPTSGAEDGGERIADEPAAEPVADQTPEQSELSTSRPRSLRIAGWRRVSLTSFPPTGLPAQAGVFIVELAGEPIFVGDAVNLLQLFSRRLLELYQLGFIARGALPTWARVTIWLGQLEPNQASHRKTVCHAIVRLLSAAALSGKLRNPIGLRSQPLMAVLSIRDPLPPPLLARASNAKGMAGNIWTNPEPRALNAAPAMNQPTRATRARS